MSYFNAIADVADEVPRGTVMNIFRLHHGAVLNNFIGVTSKVAETLNGGTPCKSDPDGDAKPLCGRYLYVVRVNVVTSMEA